MTEELIAAFYRRRNAARAPAMAAYMKNQFAFLGIGKPERAGLQRPFLRQAQKGAAPDWDSVARLWALPEREFQYLAVDYLAAVRAGLRPPDIERLRGLITAKAWWDTVDALAATVVGTLCASFPELVASHMLPWAGADHIWLVRTAILFQLKYKQRTDPAVLAQIIDRAGPTSEFFINKAIGWALREYSKTNPAWVREFIGHNRLHPLSVREGGKYL